MNPVISAAISTLPAPTDTPRRRMLEVPDAFDVDASTLRFNVYIRTQTARYGLNGWGCTEDNKAWQANCEALMREIGFQKTAGWFYPSDGAPTDYLYAHPDSISGVTTLANARKLYEAIEHKGFGISNRGIDVFDVYEDLSEAELRRRLEHYQNSIRDRLLESHTTKRRNQFVMVGDKGIVGSLPGLSLVGTKCVGTYVDGPLMEIVYDFVRTVRERLVSDGWLVLHRDGEQTYYRTANKTERRALNLTLTS